MLIGNSLGNVDEDLDRPLLGHVTYIDEQANELEYSLHDGRSVLQYNTVINMALGLKDRPSPTLTEEPGPAALTKAPSKDVAVETDEEGMMTAPATTIHAKQSQNLLIQRLSLSLPRRLPPLLLHNQCEKRPPAVWIC
jgi:hypothetical protein